MPNFLCEISFPVKQEETNATVTASLKQLKLSKIVKRNKLDQDMDTLFFNSQYRVTINNQKHKELARTKKVAIFIKGQHRNNTTNNH